MKKKEGVGGVEIWQVREEVFGQRRRLRKGGGRVGKIRLQARILMGSSPLFNMR